MKMRTLCRLIEMRDLILWQESRKVKFQYSYFYNKFASYFDIL